MSVDTEQDWPSDVGYFSDEAATFGDRVAAARGALGLSQSDLCRNLGIKLKTLRAWEDDLSEPRANKLQMLGGVLNVSIVWLLTGEGDGLDGPVEDEEPLSKDATDILLEMRSLRTEYGRLNNRLARLEKRLRGALKT